MSFGNKIHLIKNKKKKKKKSHKINFQTRISKLKNLILVKKN